MTKQQLDRRLRILELERENFVKQREAMVKGRRSMLKQEHIADFTTALLTISSSTTLVG